jgi:hypothetical protein
MKNIGIFITIGIVLVVAMTWFLMSISYNNTEKGLRNKATAQKENIEAVYDRMWKVISQKAEISNEYKDAFKEIYPALIEGRYSQGDGSLMKWITESNPSFDVSLYQDLMRSVEVERNSFATEQKLVLDIIREHKNLLEQEPSSWFIKNKEPIEYVVISSTTTKKVMEERVEDNIKLF